MEANLDGDGEVGSNDGDTMPQLEASVEPDLDEDEEFEGEEDEEDGDGDDEGVEPDLVIQTEGGKDEEMVEEEEEEVDEEEEDAEIEMETAETEEGGEEEEEEDEEDYENSGNPGEVQNTLEESNEGEDTKEEDERKGSSDEPGQEMDIVITRKRSASLSSSEEGPKRKQGRSAVGISGEQHKGATDRTHDRYCWVCHKDGVYFNCKICPRSYHMRCICLPDYPEPTLPEGDGTSKVCICPECVVVMNAEEVDKRSEAMKQLSMDQLINMLKQICGRMKLTPGAEPFLKPVQPSDACDYFEYIVYPMDIQTLEKNIKQRQYGSTEAFLADAQWIVHNSIIFNSSSSPYTASAKRILKVCKQELSEIETCPECYTNAHTKSETWFVEACKRPHILVWAKLKGFPFWPAKAMKIKDDQVDVRFFGQHDRAWVNLKDCFLYSEEMPAAAPKKNTALLSAIEELNTHIARLTEAHGDVLLAKVKTPLGRELSTSEIQRLLPKFKPEEIPPKATSPVGDKEKDKGSKMTITISSIKTNPTIVSNSLNEGSSAAEKQKPNNKLKRASVTPSADVGPTTRSGKAVNATTVTEPSAQVSEADEEAVLEETEEPASVEETNKDEKLTKKELDDDFESRVPSGEILASALGLRRITRKVSHSDSGTMSPGQNKTETEKSTNVISADKRNVRAAKSTSNEDDSDSGPPTQVGRKSTVTRETPQLIPGVQIKSEPVDPVENELSEGMDQDDQEEKTELPTARSKAQDFMEHISTQAQTKPGYRFNISKDISISAIGQDSDQLEDNNNLAGNRARKSFGMSQQSVTVNHAGTVQRPSLTVQPSNKQTTQNSTQQQANPRPRLNQALQQQQPPIHHQQQQSVSRFLQSNKDIRSLTRMLKPAMSPANSNKVSAPGGVPRPNRAVPGAIQMSSLRGNNSILHKLAKEGSFKQQPIVVDSTSLRVDNINQFSITPGNQLQKVGSAIQVNQSVQGAITLPGGTITVTPLSHQGGNGNYANNISINGDRSGLSVPLKPGGSNKTNSNGLPISIVDSNSSSPAVTATPVLKSVGKSNSQGQGSRKITNMVPPSVVATVQGLQRNVNELIRVAAEAIAVDMVEHSANKNNEGDKGSKLDCDKLILKHTKELTDMRLNHELMMRELRSNMDSEKKRALQDLRRQLENEKHKAVEEAKKKQWCAQCFREALFYCCWNTSYCGYTCQEEHWPTHMATCTQNASGNSSSMSSNVASR